MAAYLTAPSCVYSCESRREGVRRSRWLARVGVGAGVSLERLGEGRPSSANAALPSSAPLPLLLCLPLRLARIAGGRLEFGDCGEGKGWVSVVQEGKRRGG